MGRVKRNQQGWYRASCLTAERLCRATLEWARQRQTQNFSGASAGLEGCLTGSMTFRRKSQLICRGRKNGGTRKRDNKHDDLTLRSQANAPDWLHSIESQREKEPIEESMMISTPPAPQITALGQEGSGTGGTNGKYTAQNYYLIWILKHFLNDQ